VGALWHSARVAGHFGEFLQGRIGRNGPVALVTLPCDCLAVRASWSAGEGFTLYQHGRAVITRARLVELFRRLHGTPPAGRLRLRAAMPPGGGAGASTASLLAVAVAVTRGGFARLPAEVQAGFCIGLEGASDPLMHRNPGGLLWASREGRVLGLLAEPPRFEIVGGFFGRPTWTDPADEDFADIEDLVADWAAAAAARDHAALGALAQESARRNARKRGRPGFERLEALAAEFGALGIVAAHTGSARGLLFRPGTVPSGVEERLRVSGLQQVLRFSGGGGTC